MQVDIPNVVTTEEQFHSAISIYVHKPHVVNKRVTTVRFASALVRSDRQYSTGKNTIDRRSLISKNPRIYRDQDEYVLSDGLSVEFRAVPSDSSEKSCGVEVSAYRFEFCPEENTIRLRIFNEEETKECLWVKEILLPKIVKWCQTHVTNSTEDSTLRLISIEDYQREYERLKVKYGKYLTTNWCESTDPQKHVFEDLGIASYLLTYWRQHASSFKRPIKFLDLGCGNGLLTFLLSSEGYPGLGIDMRRRRSWSLFEPSLFLESLIEPHSSSLHDLIVSGHYTLLIGNHSDELTPWLPVLASQCQCDVFLLPCCFFDFSGKKFISATHDDATQYEQYLSYVETLARLLDFNVNRDKLRIPSTKNICFVFQQQSAEKRTLESIRTLLLDHLGIDITREHADPQMTNHGPAVKRFKPDFYSTKFAIIEYLYKHLLTNHEPLNVSSAYALLPPNLADQLKSEQGGLKSIILSYRHALRFDPIVKLITLANPLDNLITTKQKQSPKATFKTKPCFFDTFHPDGCPLTDDKCAFSHASRIKHD